MTGRMELCLNSNNNNSNHNNNNNLHLINSSSSSSLSSSNSSLEVSSSHNNPRDNLHAPIKQLLPARKRLCRTASISSHASTFQTSVSEPFSCDSIYVFLVVCVNKILSGCVTQRSKMCRAVEPQGRGWQV